MSEINNAKELIRNYLVKESLIDPKQIKDETLIFDTGLLDSMGLLFLIEFLNETFGVEITDDELNPKNFESINSIAGFIEEKHSVEK